SWRHSINFPETIKASPISNVINAVPDRMVYSFTPQQGLKYFRMNRWQSFGFLIKKLGDNVARKKADLLPDDMVIGYMRFSSKPISVRKDAQYLGGVGGGAWFCIQPAPEEKGVIKRLTAKGERESVSLGETVEPLHHFKPFEITYDIHLLFTHVKQHSRKIRINHIQRLPNTDYQYQHLKALLA